MPIATVDEASVEVMPTVDARWPAIPIATVDEASVEVMPSATVDEASVDEASVEVMPTVDARWPAIPIAPRTSHADRDGRCDGRRCRSRRSMRPRSK
jgi:hypothetical protein